MNENIGLSLFKNKNVIFEPLKNMGTKIENSQHRTDFDAHKCAMIPLFNFEGGNSFQGSENNKNFLQKSSKDPLKASKSFQTNEGSRFYLVSVLETIQWLGQQRLKRTKS